MSGVSGSCYRFPLARMPAVGRRSEWERLFSARKADEIKKRRSGFWRPYAFLGMRRRLVPGKRIEPTLNSKLNFEKSAPRISH